MICGCVETRNVPHQNSQIKTLLLTQSWSIQLFGPNKGSYQPKRARQNGNMDQSSTQNILTCESTLSSKLMFLCLTTIVQLLDSENVKIDKLMLKEELTFGEIHLFVLLPRAG